MLASMLNRDPYHGVPLGVECAWPQMTIDLQRGKFLRVQQGAGSTVTAHAGDADMLDRALVPVRATRPRCSGNAARREW